MPANPAAQRAADRRCHLQQRGVTLDREEAVDADAAGGADAAEVVAQQVDDHDVLAAVLLVVVEGERGEGVFGGVEAARPGALHGARHDLAVAHAEEKLRREREDGAARKIYQRPVGHGLLAAESEV